MEGKYQKVESYLVPTLEKPVRLSDLPAGTFHTVSSRKGMKKAIVKNLVRIDGRVGRTADFLRGGEVIDLYQPRKVSNKPTIDVDLEVVYEDDHLAIVNKPAGIVVSGNRKWTLENALPSNLKASSQADKLPRPDPIHRLDYPTSGAILIGKTFSAVMALNKMFENREIQKTYLAITIGEMEDKGTVELPVEEKASKSTFHVLARADSPRFSFLNLVELNPHTGRKHQLRIHMASLGNPILGDLEHGIEGLILKGKGLYLHASSLVFTHPITQEPVHITIPLPKKYGKIFPEFAS